MLVYRAFFHADVHPYTKSQHEISYHRLHIFFKFRKRNGMCIVCPWAKGVTMGVLKGTQHAVI
jgi:hypothetical protein